VLQSGKASCSTSNLRPSDWGKVAIASFSQPRWWFLQKIVLFVKVRRKNNLLSHYFCEGAVGMCLVFVLTPVLCSVLPYAEHCWCCPVGIFCCRVSAVFVMLGVGCLFATEK